MKCLKKEYAKISCPLEYTFENMITWLITHAQELDALPESAQKHFIQPKPLPELKYLASVLIHKRAMQSGTLTEDLDDLIEK